MPSGDDFDSPLAFNEDANLELHLTEETGTQPVFTPDDAVQFNAAAESAPELHVGVEDTTSPIDFSPTVFDTILLTNPPDGYILEKTPDGAVWVNPSSLAVFDFYAAQRTLDAVVDGRDGRDGWDGIPGRRGPQGLRGPLGLKGEDGAPGRDGWDGAPGPRGQRGQPGEGVPGEEGRHGRDGWDGIPGVKGDTGATGATGPTGPTGPTGDRGKQGPPGDMFEQRSKSRGWDTYPVIPSTGGGGGTGANPTASVGLTAVNGSATTFMRSDAAPPIDQAIAPTWTAKHIWTGDNVDRVVLQNVVAATSVATEKISPTFVMYAEAWDPSAGGFSSTAGFRFFHRGETATPVGGHWAIDMNAGGGSWSRILTLYSSGVLDIATGFRIGGAAASGTVIVGDGTNYVAGTISAGAALPNYVPSSLENDKPPGSANAMDDEFDDSSGMSGNGNGLNARWTWRNQGSTTLSYTTPTGWVEFIPTAVGARTLHQAYPAGDWTVECKVSVNGGLHGLGNNFGGLCIVDATNGDGAAIYLLIGNATTRYWDIEVGKWTTWNTFTTFALQKGTLGAGVCGTMNFVLQYISATTTTKWMMRDINSPGRLMLLSQTDPVGGTVVGIFASGGLAEDGTTKGNVWFDYFRRTA